MSSPVVYAFIQGSYRRELLFERALDAVHSAVMDLHEQRAVPLSIHWGGRRLYDRAALERVWAACRAELEADQRQVPTALGAAARREMVQWVAKILVAESAGLLSWRCRQRGRRQVVAR
jgi:hypothetical protein